MRPALILAILLAFAPVLRADDYVEPTPLAAADAKTRALVDKLVKAFGGSDRLSRMRSVYDVVHTKEKGENGAMRDVTVSSLYIPPDRVWTKLEAEKLSATMVITPWNAFVKSTDLPTGAAVKMPDDKREELMRRMEVDPLFIIARRFYSSVRWRAGEPKKINGKTYDVLLLNSSGRDVVWHIEPETGRLISSINGDLTVEYSDWRTIKGLSVPFKTQIKKNDGRVQWFVVSDCDFNVIFDEALFKEPSVWFNPNLDLSQSWEWYNRWYGSSYSWSWFWYRYY